jgi:hypothetical protein
MVEREGLPDFDASPEIPDDDAVITDATEDDPVAVD